jgi:hypothetical protein
MRFTSFQPPPNGTGGCAYLCLMAKQLYLLDGHALVYRAHYAFITRPLMNSKKQNVLLCV